MDIPTKIDISRKKEASPGENFDTHEGNDRS
jgi:hypothetical protein